MRSIKIWLLSALIGGWGISAAGFSGSKLTAESFRDYCRRFREMRGPMLTHRPAVGDTLFVPTHSLDAGQNRYSFHKMRKALTKATEKVEGTFYDREIKHWRFAFDQNQSLFPIEKRLKGISYRGRFHIVDGHHRALISTFMGAPTVPMLLIGEDWDHLDQTAFREMIQGRPHHFAHWQNFDGTRVAPVDLCDMINDPYLTLARMLLRRVDVGRDPLDAAELRIHHHRGADFFIVVKINDDVAFLEFEIADAIRRRGFKFSDGDERTPLNRKQLLEIRRILDRERQTPGSRLAHLYLLDEPVEAKKFNFTRGILRHIQNEDCAYKLDSKSRDDD